MVVSITGIATAETVFCILLNAGESAGEFTDETVQRISTALREGADPNKHGSSYRDCPTLRVGTQRRRIIDVIDEINSSLHYTALEYWADMVRQYIPDTSAVSDWDQLKRLRPVMAVGETLLTYGADPDLGTTRSPLVYVVPRSIHDATREAALMLISHGADVEDALVKLVYGSRGYGDDEIAYSISFLMEHVADPTRALEAALDRTDDRVTRERIKYVIELLISLGADANARRPDGKPGLWVFMHEEWFDLVRMLLERGADVHARDKDGRTLIHWAAENDLVDFARWIIEFGADVHARTHSGHTPLDVVTSEEIATMLLDHGATWSNEVILGRFRDHVVDANFPMVKIAVGLGADLDRRYTEGLTVTPLMRRLYTEHESDIPHHREMAVFLSQRVTDVNERESTSDHDRLGRSLLHYAVLLGNAEMASTLLDRGADVHIGDLFGKPPLWSALVKASEDASNGGYEASEVVQLLLDHGANESAMLHDAATSKDDLSETIAVLLKRHDVDDINSGVTPLVRATSFGNAWLANVLLEHDANVHAKSEDGGWTPLHHVVRYDDDGNRNVATTLLERGADVDARSDSRWTPLHVAVKHNLKAAELLIEHGADVDARTDRGFTPLHVAAEYCLETTKLLIEQGADVNARSNGGSTPLHHASLYRGVSGAASALLENGADFTARSDNGFTAVHFAASYRDYDDLSKDNGNPQAMKALLEAGADANAKTQAGSTPLHFAATAGNFEIVEMLLRHGADTHVGDAEDRKPIDLARATLEEKGTESARKAVAVLLSAVPVTGIATAEGHGPIDCARATLKEESSEDDREVVDFLIRQTDDYRVHPVPLDLQDEAGNLKEGVSKLFCSLVLTGTSFPKFMNIHFRRFFGEEARLEEVYPHIRCHVVRSTSGDLYFVGDDIGTPMDLFRMIIERPGTTTTFMDRMVGYFQRNAEHPEVLGKILSCRVDYHFVFGQGGEGCMNYFERIDHFIEVYKRRNSRSTSEERAEAFSSRVRLYVAIKNFLLQNVPIAGSIERDVEFCQKILQESTRCIDQSVSDEW